jgi:Tol biopolymer transport system component
MRARAGAGLALFVVGMAGAPSDDDSAAFLTAVQGNVHALPADAPTVAVSANDGRYVAFTSDVPLSSADTNGYADIYVLDRTTREVTLETPTPRGFSNPDHAWPHLSGDGRFLVYETSGRSPGAPRVIVLRDRWNETSRTIERPGEPANGSSRHGTISAEGRTVVFTSAATNLVDGPDANGTAEDVYRFDILAGTLTRVSAADGRQLPDGAKAPTVSADGRAWPSARRRRSTACRRDRWRADHGRWSMCVRDVTQSVTRRVSARPMAPAQRTSYDAAINGDGRWVAFVSEASDLVRDDGNRAADIFLFDGKTRTTELVSRSESGGSANGASTHPAMSTAGTVLTFQSDASDLTCSRRCPPAARDINLVADIFTFDRRTRLLRRVSTGRTSWTEPSIGPALDGIGSVIAFSSRHPRDSTDEGDDYDLFVRLPVK